jgi:hypothetical protein
MKTFKKIAAQGDILIMKIDKMPADLVPMERENGKLVIAHSETGHHHVMTAERTRAYTLPDSIMDIFVTVEAGGDVLEHERPFDTHAPFQFEAGNYQIRRQRERAYVPEGFRRVED